MALSVTPEITIGSFVVTEFTHLTINQVLFGHHQFSLGIPYDRVEGTKGAFLTSAHQQLCGQRVSIVLTPRQRAGEADQSAGRLLFQGVVTQLELGTQGDLRGVYQVQGYAPTYLLDKTPVRRTFQKQTLRAIFQHVLQAYGNDLPTLQAKPQHTAPLPYVVQYDESDFTFLNRLAAQYGEWFYYDGTQLLLGRPTTKELPFVSDGVRAALNLTVSLRHAEFVVSQYNLAQHQPLRATSQGQAVSWLRQNSFAAFAQTTSESLFPQAMQLPPDRTLANQAELDQVAARYKSQHATSLVSGSGWGENPAMGLGTSLQVTGKGLGLDAVEQESFGTYWLTSIVHTVDTDTMYANLFEAVPVAADLPPLGPYRKAPVGLAELAEVIDHQDPDRLGRVRVRYYWPVAKPTEAESNWLRVSTPYSGDGKGQLFTPEIGSQVLVGYEHNHAEQPLILGNLFHPRNPQNAKYTNAENHLKGLQTAGGNKVVMSDKKGEQTIHLSNSNNKGTAVEVGFKGDGSITIKSNGPVTVLSPDITLEAGAKGEIKLHAKNITLVAEDDVKVSAKTKGIALDAKEKLALTSKELLAAGTDKATVQSTTELALNGGSKATLQSGKTKVH